MMEKDQRLCDLAELLHTLFCTDFHLTRPEDPPRPDYCRLYVEEVLENPWEEDSHKRFLQMAEGLKTTLGRLSWTAGTLWGT